MSQEQLAPIISIVAAIAQNRVDNVGEKLQLELVNQPQHAKLYRREQMLRNTGLAGSCTFIRLSPV